jgi:hypothetical protein
MTDTIRVLVPTGKASTRDIGMQAGNQLKGSALVIGLLDNHKHNTDKILDRLQQRLSGQFGSLRFVRAMKPEAGKGAPKNMLEDLAAECHAVVNGIGD